MGTITSGIGLISGINTGQLISELMSIDQQPVTQLQTRMATANAQGAAYTDLSNKLQSLQQVGQSLELPSSFSNSTANSSDQNVLTATTGIGAAVGSYQFQVARLVTAQQSISNGYASTNALVGAGTISLSMGGGSLNTQTNLAQLNGGNGVQRGQFRITDGSGNSSVIDMSSAVTIDDVVNQINSAMDINVHASLSNNHLVLTDMSGQPNATITVRDMGSGESAKDLGIAGTSNTGTLTGTSIDSLGLNTAVASLNDGLGIRTASNGGTDFQATLADGSTVSVSLGSAQTVGDIINAINTAGGSKLKATLDANNNSIDLTDSSTGSGTLSVLSQNGSHAAEDLGFTNTPSSGTVIGKTVLAGLDTSLISSLSGGSGLPLGTISIKNRNGASTNVNFSGAKTVQDVLNDINNSGAGVTASLNNSGNGIQIQDTTGGTGNLVIGDVNSTTAQALGIAGTFNTNTQAVKGADLHVQWVSANTQLSKYNGGKGVTPGSFSITNSKGQSATIDLTSGTFNTLGDVINAINTKGLGVTASINQNGNGLLLTDTLNGAGKLTVANVSGTTAKDLNIAGTATGNTIDGSFEKTITVSSTDTLASVQSKIQQLNAGVVANIVNDGSGVNGYHLSLTATNSGKAGQVVIDGGTTSLVTNTVVQAQDAAVFYGGSGGSQPLLITSSTNQLTNVIPGVTIQLTGASPNPVTLNITRDPSTVSKQLQTFTDDFNGLVDEITTLTQWNSSTNTGGLLLGDSTILNVQQQMYTAFNNIVKGAGQFNQMADVGMTIGGDGKITFNSDTFTSAYATDPTAVQNLFTQTNTGLGTLIDKSMKMLVDPTDGFITLQNQTLSTEQQNFQTQIDSLNALLANKKNLLEEQFANMESVLAGLQSQQSALSSITTIAPASTSSKSSSSTTG